MYRSKIPEVYYLNAFNYFLWSCFAIAKSAIEINENLIIEMNDWAYHRQAASWDAGEVMVLVVVPDVESQQVEGSVIRVGLVAFEEHVMFSYEVSWDGMQTHS